MANPLSSLPRNFGFLLLAIWLIAVGVIPLLGLGSAALSLMMNILAICAGVLILLNR